jgi:hypothetical protein
VATRKLSTPLIAASCFVILCLTAAAVGVQHFLAQRETVLKQERSVAQSRADVERQRTLFAPVLSQQPTKPVGVSQQVGVIAAKLRIFESTHRVQVSALTVGQAEGGNSYKPVDAVAQPLPDLPGLFATPVYITLNFRTVPDLQAVLDFLNTENRALTQVLVVGSKAILRVHFVGAQ